MKWNQFLAGVVVAMTAAWPVVAATLEGVVVGVSDGDTVTVLDSDKQQHKIRLSGIDAPEKSQPFGEASKQSLSEMLFKKSVMVVWDKHDRYGRTVGKIFVGGQDVNLQQIRRGMAWHYKAYAHEQPPEDRESYDEAERLARAGQRGLWREPTPTPPWDYRRQARQ